ncbi:MAG TPA: ATP-dependent DNA ligase [Thermoanaerobaculia bacterium]|nr:ATP-dependent DNA ligase [Thermoanaerobaculia bacterium]
MKLEDLAAVAARVAATAARSEKISTLAELLAAAPVEVAQQATVLLSGELPGGRIGIGPRSLVDALESTAPHSTATLEVTELLRVVAEVRGTAGTGSGRRRQELLESLLARATAPERDFTARLLLGELRQGALAGVMVEALARAGGRDPALVRRALMLSGDLQAVARAVLVGDDTALDAFRVALFRPLQPMLAQPAADLDEAWGRIPAPRAAVELKIDGARVQVHRQDGEVRVYSRSLRDVTASVPEITELATRLPGRETILDGECYAHRDGAPLPFQVTMRRFGRRLDVDALRRELPLQVRFFDCLLVDGSELVDAPLRARWQALDALLPPENEIEREALSELSQADAFLRRALAAGHEGLMWKDLESTYEAGSRGYAWLKVKSAHTLDLVVLAAEWGSGRRRGFLSNLHLGARDPAGDFGPVGGFVMLGKTFKGLTDEVLRWQTGRMLELETRREGHVVWVRPELVVEIACNNIQESPQYPSRMALRFARVKGYRPDKEAAHASTVAEVRRLFDAERDVGPVTQRPTQRQEESDDA